MIKKGRKIKIKFLKNNLKDIPFINIFYASLIINTINLAIVLIAQNSLPPEVPLFYGLPEGQDQITNSLKLMLPAIVSFGISFLNFFIALVSKNKFFRQTLIVACLVVSIFSILTVLKITLLVGSF